MSLIAPQSFGLVVRRHGGWEPWARWQGWWLWKWTPGGALSPA